MSRTAFFAMMAIAVPGALHGVPRSADAGVAASPLVVAAALQDSPDDAIRRAFRDVLRSEPSDRELRRYRGLMQSQGWNERDVREDLRAGSGSRQDSDLRGSDSRRQTERRGDDPERIVRRAYQDILGREADAAGLRLYRGRMIDERWSEQDVREALRKSPEFRDRNTMTAQKAQETVRRAYRSVFDRDPDAGSQGYVDKVLRENWSEQQVAAELRKSPEYRNKRP